MRRAIAVLLLVGAAGVAFASSASSNPGTNVTGTFSFQSDYTAPLTKTKSSEISQFTYDGPLAGTCVDTGTLTVGKSGAFRGQGREFCGNVTLSGKAGAIIARYTYAGSGTTYHGRLTFTRGFGDLAGLKGGGPFSGDVSTNSNQYDYTYSLG
jgi:hypothetical protein